MNTLTNDNVKKQIAIITGADGGFGKEFVKLIIKENVDEIWAIARNADKLKSLSEEFGKQIITFPMDLTDRKNLNVLQNNLNDGVKVKYLVNNAGYAKFCAYDGISLEDSLNMIDLNVCAVVALGLICIPYMQKGSRIINIASQASFFPLPYINIYASTKAFVRNYTRALNVELKSKGVTATAVCPGWMKTNLFERGNVGAEKGITNFAHIKTPEAVAKKAFKDAKKGKDISTYGAYVKLTRLLSKLASQKTAMNIWLKQQKIK